MRDASALHTMTVEEYFQFEERSTIKHEYVAGEVYAMSGATARHNLIAGAIFATLFSAADDGSCRVFMSAVWRSSPVSTAARLRPVRPLRM